MDNISLLSKINSVVENLDFSIFAELISTISDLIKNEKQKQELKEVMDEVVFGLIKINYDLEDENLEIEFYKLLEELVVIGFDVGKILINELKLAKNSENQTKVIQMLETIIKATSWIRKISLSQKLSPVISELLSQSLPIRIKEMLNKLNSLILPYIKNKEKKTISPSFSSLQTDKALIIQEWVKSPEIFRGLDPVVIQGVCMLDFFTREVNFEIVLDYILYSYEHGQKVLFAVSSIFPHFKKFKKFNPEKKIAECIHAALTSNTSEFTTLQSINLLKSLITNTSSLIVSYLISNSTLIILLKNLHYSEVRSFLFVYIFCNSFSVDTKKGTRVHILIEVFKYFTLSLETGSLLEIFPIIEMLNLLIPEIFTDLYIAKADEFERSEPLKLNIYKKSVLTLEGQSLIAAIFNSAFPCFWISENDFSFQELQIKIIDLIVFIIKISNNCKPLKNLLNKIIDENFLSNIQSSILNYSLNNNKEAFKLPCILVTRPVGAHMIQHARIFNEVLKFNLSLVSSISTNCWSTVFLWFFVFKSNGMLLNILCESLKMFFENSEEKKLKEVLFDKKYLSRIIESLGQKPDPEQKDFYYCAKKLAKLISEYVESHKTKFSKDILLMPGWKTLFPPVLENSVKSRPTTRSSKKGHTFILGLNSLEKNMMKSLSKNDHEIEYLSSKLDLIYKST